MLILQRLETGDHGTFGRLIAGGRVFFTGELPWRGNAPNVSCIPPGLYRGVWTLSPRFKRWMYEIIPVDKRAGIRVHSANFMGANDRGMKWQLNGCIALGQKLGWMDGQKALLLSKPAIRAFETFMDGQTFQLEVRNGHS
jgi:hypothetical protein